MTLGEWKVGIGFNPSSDLNVTKIKQGAAEMITFIDAMRQELQSKQETTPSGDALSAEIGRLCSLAQTHIEDAAMWAVKAATKGPLQNGND